MFELFHIYLLRSCEIRITVVKMSSTFDRRDDLIDLIFGV